MLEYILIRSQRKTISLEISKEKQIIVRSPLQMEKNDIELFVNKHINWIEKHLTKIKNNKNQAYSKEKLTTQKENEYKNAAKKILPEKTTHFAELMDVKPTSIKITSAQKRFGSCSSKNGICYSWRLLAYPEKAIDYVVVHELAHIKHKNHSKEFYLFIEKFLPDYKERVKLLKE